jgi:hypothetical protein
VLAVVVLPPLLVQSEIDCFLDHPSAVAQEMLQLGMTVSKAAELMNEPIAMFFLEPAHTGGVIFRALGPGPTMDRVRG